MNTDLNGTFVERRDYDYDEPDNIQEIKGVVRGVYKGL